MAQSSAERSASAQESRSDLPVPDGLLEGYDLRVLDGLDGLPSPTVRAIEIGPDGSMWLGTFGGLCRFDGREFRRFLAFDTEGLESNRIAALTLDRGKTLWIGTERGPVSRLRGGRFETVAPVDVLASVSAILEDSRGAIWLCGDRIGRWDGDSLEVLDLGGTPLDAQCTAAIETTAGEILFATRGGVLKSSGTAEGWRDLVQVAAAPERHVVAAGFLRDEAGAIWSTWANRDTLRVSGGDALESEGALGKVHGQLVLPDGLSLVSTDEGLLLVETLSDGRIAPRRLPHFKLARAILETQDGTIWMGAESHGLVRMRPRAYEFAPLAPKLGVSSVVRVTNGEREQLLFHQAKIAYLLDLDESLAPVPSGGGAVYEVRGGVMDAQGENWIATSLGVGRLDRGQLVISDGLACDVQAVALAEDGSVWAASEAVFREVLTDEGRFGRAFPAAPVAPIGAVSWSGGFASVFADQVVGFDVAALELEPLVRIEGAELRALARDGESALWITTYGDGLFRWNAGALDRWTTRHGLPDVFLGWIGRTRDRGGREDAAADEVWINSNRGAIRASVASLDRVAAGLDEVVDCELVPMSEGNGVSGAVLADGRIVLPTIHGLALVDPARAVAERARPRVVVDEVRVDGEPLESGARIAGTVDLEVHYRGILFPDSRELWFEYRLEGHDAGWVDNRHQLVARYTNLAPGDYTFRLRARAAAGPWSEPAEGIRIAVLPRWFQRGGVRSLGVLLTLGLVVLAWRLRIRSILARSRALEDEVERRRRVETELRASRADHWALLEAAHGSIVTVDSTGTITYANPASTELYGQPHRSIIGAHVSSLQVDALERAVGDVLRAGSGEIVGRWETLESSAKRADGTVIDVEFSVARQTHSAERTAVCVVRDVSNQKRMMDELRRSEERYRTLFQTAPAAIVVWRRDLTIADWNEHAEALFGWPRDQAVDRAFPKVFALDRPRHPIRMAATRALEELTPQSVIHGTHLRGGGERVCSWRFTPLVSPDGTLRAVISIATDMTEERRVERDLDGLRKRLARAEETERSRIARELHDDLSQRLAALALEMQVAVDGLERTTNDDPRAVLESIQHGLASLSTDVHALSRQLHPTVLDDLGLSRALRSECARRDRGPGPRVQFFDETTALDLEPEVALALFRISQESMQNAQKHGAAADVSVTLRQSDGRIELEVRDDGVGFDPLSSTIDGSHGLGLASMRERARLVGADFRIRAAKGRGTRVTVAVEGMGADAAAAG